MRLSLASAALVGALQLMPLAQAEPFPAVGVHSEGDQLTAQYDEFSQWLGKPVRYRIVFTARNTWSDVAEPYYMNATRRWIGADARNVEVMSVPLLLKDTETFAMVVGGNMDPAFASLAKNIQATGRASQVIIRLGWEHNGNWYPWSAIKNPAGYVAAYRHVVAVMRRVSPDLRFDWTTDFQSHSASDWTLAYPGDDVVDIMSMDVYDEYNGGWSDIESAQAGLIAFRAFAIAHGKPEAYPEWGCSTGSHGHGDSPDFVERFHAWLGSATGPVLYQAYWNTNLGGPDAAIQGVNAGRVPAAAAKYRALFSQ